LKVIEVERPIRLHGGDENFEIERMIWIDGAFSLRHHAIAPDGSINHRSRFHAIMREFRQFLLSALPPVESASPRHIFLDRRTASRGYNSDAVRRMLAERGFVAVDPSEFSFAEQMSLFASAETLVGPTGAAWANLLFVSPETKSLYWTPQQFAGGQVWSSLAAVAGSSVRELTYPHSGPFKAGEYRLDVELLTAHINTLMT
jgi:capsular polysaccharide biosynthesis protein